jgi:serine/threonine protein kinase
VASRTYIRLISYTETSKELSLSLLQPGCEPEYLTSLVLFVQQNVLIDGDGTPLLDFGGSILIGHRGFTASTFAGSARNMAPELVPGEADAYSVNFRTFPADVYAFSMVALEVSHLPSAGGTACSLGTESRSGVVNYTHVVCVGIPFRCLSIFQSLTLSISFRS